MTSVPRLERRLGFGDAMFVGLGAMLGAGVFAVYAPAAAVAGSGLLIGLAVAVVVATCNALSSAQLAAQYPASGGTYAFGRERLGEWWGFAAGWSFVIGKTASCAAMALTFAAYAVPAAWSKPVAIGAVVVLTAVNYLGITKTAAVTRVLVIVVLLILALVVIAGTTAPASESLGVAVDGTPYGVLQSAGLLFFAFAGYARLATLGEEVRNPRRIIPRAIAASLAVVVVVYATLAIVSLHTLGAAGLASSARPLTDVVVASGWSWAVPVVVIGAASASLGALLALIAGVSRTSLAMARNDDLPRPLAAVHPRFSVPHRAEVTLAAALCVILLLTDVRGAIAFSSFGVLLYYAIANLSALTQGWSHRLYPRAVAVLGLVGCLVLVVTLPLTGIAVGVLVLGVGLAARFVVLRRRRSAAGG